jgi:hypothetical protein
MAKSVRSTTIYEIVEGYHKLKCYGSFGVRWDGKFLELRLDRFEPPYDGWCSISTRSNIRDLINELEAIHDALDE